MSDFYHKYRGLFEDDGQRMNYKAPTAFDPKYQYRPPVPAMVEYSFNKYPSQPTMVSSPKKNNYNQHPQPFNIPRPNVQSREKAEFKPLSKAQFRVQDNIFGIQNNQNQDQFKSRPPLQVKPTQAYPLAINDVTVPQAKDDGDILDAYIPSYKMQVKPKRIVTAQPIQTNQGPVNTHNFYRQRMDDLEQLRKRYNDPNILMRQLDHQNPYKLALQKRVLNGLLKGQRQQKLIQQIQGSD